jgi:anti-sigma regulatory factor (Ser/Thr protein kinase)
MLPSPYTQIDLIDAFHWRLVSNDGRGRLETAITDRELTLPEAIELLCIEKHVCTSPNALDHFRSNRSRLWRLLNTLDWPSCPPGSAAKDGGTHLMALPLHSQNWEWTKFLQSLQRDLKQHGFPENLSGALTGAMGEMVDNVWQHSQSSLPGLAGYEVVHRHLNFAVADLGVGILQSIRKNPSYRFLNSSMEALQKAILRGVSRFRDQGRGYGFSTLLQSVAELWGFTRLRSSEAVLVFDRRTEKRRRLQKYLPPLPGVQIAVSCGLDTAGGPYK